MIVFFTSSIINVFYNIYCAIFFIFCFYCYILALLIILTIVFTQFITFIHFIMCIINMKQWIENNNLTICFYNCSYLRFFICATTNSYAFLSFLYIALGYVMIFLIGIGTLTPFFCNAAHISNLTSL